MNLLAFQYQVKELEEEKTHSQQRTRELEEKNHGLQQQVNLHDHCYVDSSINNLFDCLLYHYEYLDTIL